MPSAALAQELILRRYRPLRPLGSGGMGHVWLVRDEQTGLDVALKIVPREGKAATRAEREARAAAALRHPRCQRVYALARDGEHVYIAYEYVPGRTLRRAIDAGELDDRGAVEAAAQILDALAHAHAKGIVHRDVKPSNALLAETDALDLRLLDFGLAQMEEFDTLTAIGDVPGTLTYVSPERLLGKTATEAADVWAVGVILWEALAGRHPFRGVDATETSRRIQAGAPPLEQVRPDLPRPLCEAVAGALSLNPARRPAAGALALRLRSLAEPNPRARRLRGHRADRGAATLAALREVASSRLAASLLPAGTAALFTGWVASTMPFYPAGWPLALAAAAGGLAALAPRAGLAFALAAAFFPLANASLGAAALYAGVAAVLLALAWRDPRAGLLPVVGPLLAAVGALALVPLASQLARGWWRRAACAASSVLLAGLVAGLAHEELPFAAGTPPLELGIEGSERPGAVAYALWTALAAHPVLLVEAAVLAAAAAALPAFRRRGPWGAAAFGALLLAGTALAAPSAPLLPLVAAAWAAAAALALGSAKLD